jgi:hypothetical protein
LGSFLQRFWDSGRYYAFPRDHVNANPEFIQLWPGNKSRFFVPQACFMAFRATKMNEIFSSWEAIWERWIYPQPFVNIADPLPSFVQSAFCIEQYALGLSLEQIPGALDQVYVIERRPVVLMFPKREVIEGSISVGRSGAFSTPISVGTSLNPTSSVGVESRMLGGSSLQPQSPHVHHRSGSNTSTNTNSHAFDGLPSLHTGAYHRRGQPLGVPSVSGHSNDVAHPLSSLDILNASLSSSAGVGVGAGAAMTSQLLLFNASSLGSSLGSSSLGAGSMVHHSSLGMTFSSSSSSTQNALFIPAVAALAQQPWHQAPLRGSRGASGAGETAPDFTAQSTSSGGGGGNGGDLSSAPLQLGDSIMIDDFAGLVLHTYSPQYERAWEWYAQSPQHARELLMKDRPNP